eukprot:Skav201736  [mRNA]  locus=scaffold2498:66869:76741:- [translate_table: standard]
MTCRSAHVAADAGTPSFRRRLSETRGARRSGAARRYRVVRQVHLPILFVRFTELLCQFFFGLKLLLQSFCDLIDLLVGQCQLLLEASLQLCDVNVAFFQSGHGIFVPQNLPFSPPLAEGRSK